VGSNSVTLVEMRSCWFGVPLSHIVRKVVGCVEEVELWDPSSFSAPSYGRGVSECGWSRNGNRHGDSFFLGWKGWSRDHLWWV
jgi:hypothetical protein